jgi:glycosyltransferase involved in cell wall biosynthesis
MHGQGRQFLHALLYSIKKLNGKFEVVVSDNSNDDEIKTLCEKFEMEINYIRNDKTFGVSNNTNNAIKNAQYDIIKPMYQDDLFLNPNALILFEQSLQRRSWSATKSIWIDEHGKSLRTIMPRWSEQIIKGGNTIGMPSVIAFRKNEIEFDSNLHTLSDCEFYYQLNKKFGVPTYINQTLVAQRIWSKSTSHIIGDNRKSEYELVKVKHNL